MKQLTVARPNAGQGIAWMKAGWNWFRLAPMPWMGMAALALLIMIVPFGLFVYLIFFPYLVAGFLSASKAAENGEPVTFLHLGVGFRSKSKGRLAMLSAIGAVYLLLIGFVVGQVGKEGFIEFIQLSQTTQTITLEQLLPVIQKVRPAIILGLTLIAPFAMATWFATALVLFDGFTTSNALWWSLWACVVNWRPILLYSLWLGLLGIVAMLIPIGLGFLVFLPWIMTSTYAAYRAMFVTVESE